MANSRKLDTEKLIKKIEVRCNESEFKRWQNMAESNGVTMSKLMRARMDNYNIQSKMDAKAVAEIRRQGGLLKHLLSSNPHLDASIKSEIKLVLNHMITTMNEMMNVQS